MKTNQAEQSIQEIRDQASHNIKSNVRKAVIEAAFGFLTVIMAVISVLALTLNCWLDPLIAWRQVPLCVDYPEIVFWSGLIALPIYLGYLGAKWLWRENNKKSY